MSYWVGRWETRRVGEDYRLAHRDATDVYSYWHIVSDIVLTKGTALVGNDGPDRRSHKAGTPRRVRFRNALLLTRYELTGGLSGMCR